MRCIRHDRAYTYPNCTLCVVQDAIICELVKPNHELKPVTPTVVTKLPQPVLMAAN